MDRYQEREELRHLVQQWNANRLDLFALSDPNEDLEFHGVMRFYYLDDGSKVATKCIRVSSTATTNAVIETLIEKFRPDMRMLSSPDYSLFEIHENGSERKMSLDEKPLLVQLNWHKDDREGRFLLRRFDDTSNSVPSPMAETSFKRKLSKREKKQLKKQEKLRRMKSSGGTTPEQPSNVAEKLYSELPETSFTRSISNPEAVMRRRRQQKLEKKLQQFRSRDGGPDTGGTLKIYGESLCRDVPYKTLLLSVKDSAATVVKEMLDKYGLDNEEALNYCLIQVVTPGSGEGNNGRISATREYVLDDDDCPLAILMMQQSGSITFHVRKRPADYQPRKRKKKKEPSLNESQATLVPPGTPSSLPMFLEINPDGSEVRSGSPTRYFLQLNVTEVGSATPDANDGGQCLQIFGPSIQPRHCVIAHMEGIVTVTPCSRDAETYVNGQRIYDTTLLQHGAVVRFGRVHTFRFLDQPTSRPVSFVEQRSLMGTTPAGTPPDNLSIMSKRDSRAFRTEPILPASLEVGEAAEDSFLNVVIRSLDPNVVHFKLAPTYVLYLAARYRASKHFREELSPPERAIKLTHTLTKVARMIEHTTQSAKNDPGALAFWMANASELLHFLKCDRHVSAYSLDAQDILAECVQVAFRNLVGGLTRDLDMVMGDVLGGAGTRRVVECLSAGMATLRRCRVNAALTIQLFSHLFHFVNRWMFNRIVGVTVCEQGNLCSTQWGHAIAERLADLETWAEKQGLDLAADCHLARITQAAHLLQAPKWTPEDIAMISSACFKLNSMQLRALLEKFTPTRNEPEIPRELVESVVRVAENTADELLKADGRVVRLEEDEELGLAFMLPEDGYSCDVVRGLPQGLPEFLAGLQRAGSCRLVAQPASPGLWTIYMSPPSTTPPVQYSAPRPTSRAAIVAQQQQQQPPPPTPQPNQRPEVVTIRLQKSNSGMGLSIVAAKGVGQDRLGIYIKSVVKGGAADQDGRLQAGDQLLQVDGHSLVGITQEKAAEIMMKTGATVVLSVAKQGAFFHGLATLLSQPSPAITRAGGQETMPRHTSERDIPGSVASTPRPGHVGAPPQHAYSQSYLAPGSAPQRRPMPPSAGGSNPTGAVYPGQRLPASKSVPALHSHDETPPQRLLATTPVPLHHMHHQPPPGSQQQQHQQQQQQLSQPYHQQHQQQHLLHHQHQQPEMQTHHGYQHRSTQNLASPSMVPGAYATPPGAYPSTLPSRGHFQQQLQHQQHHHHQHQHSASRGAKFQEMSEEVRRREARGMAATLVSSGGVRSGGGTTPRTTELHNGRLPTTTSGGGGDGTPTLRTDRNGSAPPISSQTQLSQHISKIFSPKSPWEREAEEKEAERRVEAARLWREEQIALLESLPSLNQRQEDQLKALRLEREFQRRAEEESRRRATVDEDEHEEDDDDEDEEEEEEERDEDDEAEAKDVRLEISRSRDRFLNDAVAPADHEDATRRIASLAFTEQNNNTILRASNPSLTSLSRQEKLEEMRRKAAQLEAAQQVEQRIIREAQRRQQEDVVGGSGGGRRTPRGDVPPPLPSSSPPAEPGTRRLDNLIRANGGVENGLTDSNANLNYTPTHPETFLTEATELLAQTSPFDSSVGAGNTPGVIGAQEVYRDPRQRRLAEKASAVTTAASPNPEKLTFREKMKMFAVESGEGATPKDKVKISKAQREIED
ncbi:unnamed protein product [Notodromas monacha]|uniref:Afadin n=1 Tax=Notodromas monacha TaxID=399045 RepID=A0A7R9BCY0_9CRUS|nr:unnamed protein product [Notodromas monacha]CAG0912478.1 unnamed protein product [Notodromas monacha]